MKIEKSFFKKRSVPLILCLTPAYRVLGLVSCPFSVLRGLPGVQKPTLHKALRETSVGGSHRDPTVMAAAPPC